MMKNLNFVNALRTKLNNTLKSKVFAKFLFIFTGIASIIWFLIRVIPKPQRAAYPCMRAAAPMMSGFVLYLLSLGGSMLFFRKTISHIKQAKFKAAVISFVVFIAFLLVFGINDTKYIIANSAQFAGANPITWDSVLPDGRNNPMGEGRGIFPGRVAWVWNPSATNTYCTQTITNAFFMPINNVQDTINVMADRAIKVIGGKTTVADSWDAIFKHFNNEKNGVESGYTPGQTIFIKINNGQAGWNINLADLSEKGQYSYMTGQSNIALSETSPAPVLAFIRQLVDSCGIAQENIMVGEPMTHVYKSMYDVIHSKYPNVKIMDKENYTTLGRTTSAGWQPNCITWSDKGMVMTQAITDDLMIEMYNADYLINIASLKAHARSGVSLTSKNHFGSSSHNGTFGASALHVGSINVSSMGGANGGNDNLTGARGSYHMYRVLTDIMIHPKIGKNTVLFIVDGLWGGIEGTDMPVKWQIYPFNSNWPNSLFVSQDEVAIQSVCIDFLRAEAKINYLFNNRPLFPAVDDFLHQAANSTNWPTGLKYDPAITGKKFESLGVHEHWNNDYLKQYTRDLKTGEGIELYRILSDVPEPNSIESFKICICPNPAKYSTNIKYSLKFNSDVSIYLVSLEGKIIRNIKKTRLIAGEYSDGINLEGLKSGMYICVIDISGVITPLKLIKQ